MTRETKVGLVVACSFLCLVGIVVASKMNGGDDPAYPQEPPKGEPGPVAAVNPPAPPEKPKKIGQKQPGPPAPAAPIRENGPTPIVSPNPPLNNLASNAKTPEQIQKELTDAIQKQKKKESELPPVVPPVASTNPNPDPTLATIGPDGKLTMPGAGPQANNSANSLNPPSPSVPAPMGIDLLKAPPQPTAFGGGDPVPMPPPLPQSKKDESPPPLPAAPPVAGANPMKVTDPLLPPTGKGDLGTAGLPMPATTPPPLKDSFPVTNVVPAPAPPTENKSPIGLPASPPAPTPTVPLANGPNLPPPNAAPAAINPSNQGVPLPPAALNNTPSPASPMPLAGLNTPNQSIPLPPAGLNTPNPASPLPPATINTPNQVSPLPSIGATQPNLAPSPAPPQLMPAPSGPVPTISSTQLPSTPPIVLSPPGAGSPAPTVPGVAAAGVTQMPQVRSIEPDIVRVNAGETNFAQLSKRLYGTDQYAGALQAFNRDHWNALTDGKALALNQPILNPNQQVLHPPIGILERDYAKWIGGAAPNPVMPVIGAPPAVRTIPVVPSATPVTTTPAGARVYTVQSAAGESIRDIARRVLGNADRWTDIYRINPTLQPQFAIPVGTQLTLP